MACRKGATSGTGESRRKVTAQARPGFSSAAAPLPAHKFSLHVELTRAAPWDESAVVQHCVCDWMDERSLGQMS